MGALLLKFLDLESSFCSIGTGLAKEGSEYILPLITMHKYSSLTKDSTFCLADNFDYLMGSEVQTRIKLKR